MKKILKILLELVLIYSFSGGLYLMIETIYRFFANSLPTNLGMYYLAGVIGIIAYFINDTIFNYDIDFIFQSVVMTIITTLFEGIYGSIFNKDYNIWDYRKLPLSFFNNQCNLIFVSLWFIIIIITIPMLDYIDYKCFQGKRPYYMIFGKKIEPFI